MRGCILLIFLMTSNIFAFTNQELDKVTQQGQSIASTAIQLYNLGIAVKIAQNNGFGFNASISTNTVALSDQQTQDIINAYQTLKAQLQSQFLALP